jgi:hypothetical protein
VLLSFQSLSLVFRSSLFDCLLVWKPAGQHMMRAARMLLYFYRCPVSCPALYLITPLGPALLH